MTSSTKWSLGLLLLSFVVGCTSQDVFSEELLTGWLTPHHLLVHLRFDQGTTASRLHTSFPHAIQHLATTLPLYDVELSLTSGRWRFSEWGWPLVAAKPVGAVLDASFHSGLDAAALTAHWAALVNALSGLSCASLGLLHDPASVSGGSIRLRDLMASSAAGGSSATNRSSAEGPGGLRGGQRLHALLPHEPLCTENLTPWLRLLPCRDQAGLASLLRHRPTVFGAEYVSLGLLLERRTTPRGRRGVRFVQTFTVVLRTAPGPQYTQPPHQQSARRAAGSGSDSEVSDLGPELEQILSARVDHFCPAALRSQAFVAEPLARRATGSTEGGSCSATDMGAPGGGGGSCWTAAAAAAAPPDGSLLLLPTSAVNSAPPSAAASVSLALPWLRMYDTLELLESGGGDKGLGLRLPIPPLPLSAAQPCGSGAGDQSGGGGGAAGPLVAGGADLLVERYVTGSGLLRGGMVLRVQRSAGLRERLAVGLAAGCGSGGGGSAHGGAGGGGVGGVCALCVLCVHQLFPWYVRPWLHTFVVQYDGQEVPLRPHVVAQRVVPALARASLGVLDLCLHVPPAVAEVQLRLAFSKAFLTVFEYPPDAHRGFDVPAAAVSYLDPLHGAELQWRAAAVAADEEGAAREGGRGGGGDGSAGEESSSPLLSALSLGPVQQVYTPGLLVPLAAPDFSMPYNVICLSSTVLAVYFGAVLNLLTRRGRDVEAEAAAAAVAGGRAKASKAGQVAQAVAMVALFGALALYLDSELRAQAEALLAGLGINVGTPKPPGCGAQC